jgi:superfamily II DNA or RNA helicase
MKFRLNQDNTKLILIDSTKAEYNQLKLYLTRKVKNYRFQKRVKLGVWDGSISYFGSDGSINFGLWQEVYQCCKEYNFPFIIENKDQFPINKEITKEKLQSFIDEFYKDHKTKEGNTFIPYDHQVEAIFQILKYQFGIAEIATAGGKSLVFGTLLFYYLKYVNPDAKFLLIVPNISLVTQFYNDLNDYNFGFNSENKNPLDIRIDEVMSDKPRKYRDEEKKPNIYIGTYQSLEKWPREWFRQFDVVATDEAHTAKAQTLISILTRTFGSAKIRFGMSGTYPSPSSVEILTIESLLGPKLINISAKSLIDKGLISAVKIKAILLHHDNRKFAEGVYNIRKRGDWKGNMWLILQREKHL